jgi:arsenical pump membrane protein
VLTVIGLFLIVGTLSAHGLEEVLAAVAGASPDGFTGSLRLAATASAGANLADNLPAYLAMETVADNTAERTMVLLIGVNFGCLLTLWGSLATLLWRDRCRAAGVEISWRSFLWRGAVLVPAVLVASVAALVV